MTTYYLLWYIIIYIKTVHVLEKEMVYGLRKQNTYHVK